MGSDGTRYQERLCWRGPAEITGLDCRRQSEEWEVGVKLSPAYEDVSLEAKERPLLVAVTKQRSDDRDWTENTSLCVIVICKV
jgi:hypothetical protein